MKKIAVRKAGLVRLTSTINASPVSSRTAGPEVTVTIGIGFKFN